MHACNYVDSVTSVTSRFLPNLAKAFEAHIFNNCKWQKIKFNVLTYANV